MKEIIIYSCDITYQDFTFNIHVLFITRSESILQSSCTQVLYVPLATKILYLKHILGGEGIKWDHSIKINSVAKFPYFHYYLLTLYMFNNPIKKMVYFHVTE